MGSGTRLMPVAFVLSTFFVPSRMRHYTTFIGMLEVVTARIERLVGNKASVEDFLDTKAQQMWASYQQDGGGGSSGGRDGREGGNVQALSGQIRSSDLNHNKQ